jgi:hypothetical protein
MVRRQDHFVVRCWTEYDQQDFDKSETFYYDIVEFASDEVFMRFSGSYDRAARSGRSNR